VHKGSLHRRLSALTEATRDKVRRREILRDKAKANAAIRAALAGAKIDPKKIWALGKVDTAQAELARLGDNPEMQGADAAFIAADPVLAVRESYAAEIAGRISRFAGKPRPNFGASLYDWYAWSLANRPRA
jgi:hypothetical protein